MNPQTEHHEFQPASKDKHICQHCGLSAHATIHPNNFFHVVDAPKHYCSHKVTTVQLIDDWNLDFFTGNVVKYVERFTMKDGVQDLKKAKKYLEMKIELMEKGELKETITHG